MKPALFFLQADEVEEELGFKDISFSGPFFIVYMSGIIVAFLLVFAIFVQTFYILKRSKSKSPTVDEVDVSRRNNTFIEASEPYQLEEINLSSFRPQPRPAPAVKVNM